MCSPVRCRRCGKTTWSGCGDHVEQVMSRIPKDQQCTCNGGSTGKQSGTGDITLAAPKANSGFWKIFGR